MEERPMCRVCGVRRAQKRKTFCSAKACRDFLLGEHGTRVVPDPRPSYSLPSKRDSDFEDPEERGWALMLLALMNTHTEMTQGTRVFPRNTITDCLRRGMTLTKAVLELAHRVRLYDSEEDLVALQCLLGRKDFVHRQEGHTHG